MKRLSIILTAILGLAGAISGAALQSAAIGMIAYAATNSVEVATLAFVVPFTLSFFLPESRSGFAFDLVFTQGICEKVQSSLNAILGSTNPALKRTQVGYLQAITSPQNTAGTQQVPIDPGDGKKKEVRIKYLQRGTDQDLTDTKPTGCATEIEKEPFEETVSITNYLGTKGIKFNESQMRRLCEADSEFMAGVINGELDPLIVQLNKNLITIQAANFGAFNPAIALPKEVDLLEGALSRPLYFGESIIMEDMENIDSARRPIVIGGGKLAHYVRQVGIGCCNDFGIELSQAGNMDFFRDRFVGPILGNVDDFIALVPGYVQLLTYNEYVGSYVKENDVFSHTTITDPVTGIKFDMKWHYNDCDDFYFVQFGINYEMWFIPANSFAAYDELEGVNFTFHYRATQA
jgi:hypothetical protein